MIGIAFDGTGYGTDGAVWGGEVLLADYKGFSRVAHLTYVPLAGGDASVAPALPDGAGAPAGGRTWRGPPTSLRCMACPAAERRVLLHQLETGLGVRADLEHGPALRRGLLAGGVRQVADYEAQAAIELEGVSPRASATAAPTRSVCRGDATRGRPTRRR